MSSSKANRVFTLFAVTFLLSGAVSAVPQDTTSTSTSTSALPTSTSGLTECILNCSTSSLSAGGCSGITDFACVCTSEAFQSAANECLSTNCTSADMTEASALQAAECVGYTVSSTDSATATATPTSTTSTANAASTSTTPASSGASHASSASVASGSSAASAASSHASSASASGSAAASSSAASSSAGKVELGYGSVAAVAMTVVGGIFGVLLL